MWLLSLLGGDVYFVQNSGNKGALTRQSEKKKSNQQSRTWRLKILYKSQDKNGDLSQLSLHHR